MSNASRIVVALFFATLAPTLSAWANDKAGFADLQKYIQDKDYLGARVLVYRLNGSVKDPVQRERIYWSLLGTPDVGEDVLHTWEEGDRALMARGGAKIWSMRAYMSQADSLLYAKKYIAAAETYKKAAEWLHKRRQAALAEKNPSQTVVAGIDELYPYVLHAMARAYYGAHRYREALEVYSWIPQGYARYHKVLFEKMWTAYYAGRADQALGAIYSLHSAYFSDYVDPETYLVQLYVFKRLCRTEEIPMLLNEVRRFREKIENGSFTYEDWANSEIFTKRLLNLSRTEDVDNDWLISANDRRAERKRIQNLLMRSFEGSKSRLVSNLQLIEAYSTLATTPGMDRGFEPIHRVKDRYELIRKNLEVWPAEAKGEEEWADEVGHGFYLGDDQCKK